MDLDNIIHSLEAVSDGFALFDPDERLVLVNNRFRQIFGASAKRLVPGARYEDLLRAAVAAGENPDAMGQDPEHYIQRRLALFRHPRDPFEFLADTGRWVLVSDHKAPDGSTICVRTDITELKRREAALAESEKRYRQLVDLSPDGIAVHDTAGRGRFLNRAGMRLLGVPEGQTAEDLSLFDMTTMETIAEAGRLLRGVVSGELAGRPLRMQLRTYDKRTIFTELTAVPFESGGETLVLVIFRDTSEQEKAHERLRQSEERARTIIDTALDAIVGIDPDGRIGVFNPAAERAFGWGRSDVLGRSVSETIIPHHHRKGHDGGMARLRNGQSPRLVGQRIEVEALKADGTIFPAELALTEVPLGNTRGYTAFIRDITETKRAQRDLAEKNELLETMLANIGVGVVVYGPDGRILVTNEKLRELSGLPADILKPGTLDRDIVRHMAERGEYPDETIEESLAYFDQMRHDGAYLGERRRPNGQWLQIRHSPMPGGGYVCLFTDVTEQKSLESQLLQAQKMDALGQLAGGIAHDFNNILSVIGGYAELARRAAEKGGEQTAPIAGQLDRIVQGVKRASVLTRELLTFARRKMVEPRDVDLAAVVRNQQFLLSPLLGETIDLAFELPEKPVWVAVDPDLMAQAVVNLAINARDAMPEGGRLTVALRTVEADAPRPREIGDRPAALLSVRDAGTGMSEEVKARIFEPFFTTKPPGQGTGLGLSMVYGTVRQVGGAIEVESAPGEGTVFHIWLPLTDAPAPVAGARPPGVRAGPGQGTILVAEDEPDLLALVAETLTDAGYDVIAAGDGAEALELFDAGAIDLLLTDIVMPELGGIRLAQLVQELDPGVPVVFMTGYPSRGGYSQGDLPPGATVLYKPIDLATLQAVVAEAICGGEVAAP
ncbi:MAG TPA: PAS-domain containing protein [Azospirillaceae bacterium]|nr:PAS-domain containing protein [Azospirillaceae bacterium]